MGKHTNKTQKETLISFMEEHPDIAKGFTKRAKPVMDSLWQQLTDSLNSVGPPTKDLNGWKKTWTDWKCEVKKKLAHNKMEERATGGGPFSKLALSQTDEAIVRICCMAQAVEGVEGIALGSREESDTDDETPSTSSKRRRVIDSSDDRMPKRPRVESSNERFKRFLEEDNRSKKELSEKLDKIIEIQQENANSLKRVYRAIEKGNDIVGNAVTGLTQEVANVSSRLLQAMQERNDIERQQVELDMLKFQFESSKTSK